MPDEIKFPLNFNSCPNCGSTRRLADIVLNQEKEKGKVGKEAKASIQVFHAVIADPRMVTFEAPAIMAFMDICADCGTMYCVHAQLGKATRQVTPRGDMRPFGFPQSKPEWS